jgi:hypothetical protein
MSPTSTGTARESSSSTWAFWTRRWSCASREWPAASQLRVLGKSLNVLHGHVHARYDWEPPERIGGPVWRYPREVRYAPEHAYGDDRHGELRAAVAGELQRFMAAAY